MESTSDGKKVELYYFKVSAIAIYNSVLRNVESDRLKKFEVIHFQLPKFRPLTSDLLDPLSTKIKEYITKLNRNSYKYDSYSYSSSYSFTSFDNVKLWQVTDGSDTKQLMNQLYKACRANTSYCYKIYFPGEFIDLQNKSIEEMQLPP